MDNPIVSILKLAINILLLPVLFVVWLLSAFTDWLVVVSARSRQLDRSKYPSVKKQEFAKALGYAVADFKEVFIFLDDTDHDAIMSRALSNYLEKNAEETNYKASDFYLDAMVGAECEIVKRKLVPEDQSLDTYLITDSFLHNNPHYLTDVTSRIMDNYRYFLITKGILKNQG